MEIWKQYRDTNYEVSNTGKVRNKETLKELKQFKKNYGKKENDYMRIKISINNKSQIKAVHRLVAECFLEDYSEKLEVNHKNNIRYDNRVENLEMTTKEENYQYSIDNGNGSQRKTVLCKNEEEILYFRSLWQAGKYIKIKYNKNIEIDHICTNIKNNIKGKCKTAYGYNWSLI